MVQTQTQTQQTYLSRKERMRLRAARHNAERERERLRFWAISNGLGRQVPRSCASRDRFSEYPHIYVCRNAKALTGAYRGKKEAQAIASAYPSIRRAV